jgi:hypothetical protein
LRKRGQRAITVDYLVITNGAAVVIAMFVTQRRLRCRRIGVPWFAAKYTAAATLPAFTRLIALTQ